MVCERTLSLPLPNGVPPMVKGKVAALPVARMAARLACVLLVGTTCVPSNFYLFFLTFPYVFPTIVGKRRLTFTM